jgi:hypothetical protein
MSLSLFATATLLLATAAPAAGAELDPAAPLPGYWELANTWVFVFHFRSVQRKCFSGADISGVLRGPSNGHYTCSYPVREVGDGRLLLRGTCVETHGQVAQIAAEGTYEPTAFQLKAVLTTRIAGVPLSGSGSTVARRLGDHCPEPAPDK